MTHFGHSFIKDNHFIEDPPFWDVSRIAWWCWEVSLVAEDGEPVVKGTMEAPPYAIR